MKRYFVASLLALALFGLACEQRVSPDIASLPPAGKLPPPGDTSYVLQSPQWSGFNHPEAVIVGNEPFIYLADTQNDRVVMLDLGGGVVGFSQPIRHPVALAEDKRLQLLVCAQFDTLLPGRSVKTTFGAIYRLDLVSAAHSIGAVTPRRVVYEPGDSTRRYTGVATLSDNSYYVTRVGPKNSILSFDRDNAILQFSKTDSIINSISASSNFSPDGTGLLAIHNLNGIATLPTGRSTEFVYSQIVSNAGIEPLFKVQWIQLVAEGQTFNWQSKFYTYRDGDLDILHPMFFSNPRSVTLDPSGNLFVADAGSKAIFRFTSRGVQRFSITVDPNGQPYFSEPYGVAYFDKTVYVADRVTGKVLRFKLSTDR